MAFDTDWSREVEQMQRFLSTQQPCTEAVGGDTREYCGGTPIGLGQAQGGGYQTTERTSIEIIKDIARKALKKPCSVSETEILVLAAFLTGFESGFKSK